MASAETTETPRLRKNRRDFDPFFFNAAMPSHRSVSLPGQPLTILVRWRTRLPARYFAHAVFFSYIIPVGLCGENGEMGGERRSSGAKMWRKNNRQGKA